MQSRPLKIDGEELQDFIDQITALRFLNEGSEILSAPKGINFNRDELIGIFKNVNKLLRKEGLRDGYERFSAFSEILFLKLIDEFEKLSEHKGEERRFDDRFLWSHSSINSAMTIKDRRTSFQDMCGQSCKKNTEIFLTVHSILRKPPRLRPLLTR